MLIVLLSILLINGFFLFIFIQDIKNNKAKFLNEKVNPFIFIFFMPIIFGLSAFGISDFAMSTILYRKLKIIPDNLLPATLNTQCVIPVAVMALLFISIVNVDIATLLICIAAQVLGAYLGPRFVVRFSVSTIRRFICVGLLSTAVFVIAGKYHLLPAGGVATGLSGIKLFVAAFFLFIFGALNNIGIGSYAPTMVTIYALGMNPVAAFPIMMGACTFALPVGSMQFIKYGEYSRKITAYAIVFGSIGVIVGVHLFKNLDLSKLQWIIVGVLIYSGLNLLKQEIKERRVGETYAYNN